jgi:hypothetical protein
MAQDIAFSPAPQMELLDNILREKFGGHDTWITVDFLDVDRCIPGIPAAYKQEQQENRAVYIKGFCKTCRKLWHDGESSVPDIPYQ